MFVVGGLVVGKLASGKWSDAKTLCPAGTCATDADLAQANSLADAARTRGTISDVLVGAGVIAAAAGVYSGSRRITTRRARPPRCA